MSFKSNLESRPRVKADKPIVNTGRISTELIKRKLADGETIGRFHASYPHLRELHVPAELELDMA